MDPLIKWPGGKSKEFSQIRNLIPSFERYVEPFFGGGAVFFELEPESSAINDISKELVQFYSQISEPMNRSNFKEELYGLLENWENISIFLSKFNGEFIKTYNKYKIDLLTDEELEKEISVHLEKKSKDFDRLFEPTVLLNLEELKNKFKKSLIKKLQRMHNKVDIQNNFTKESVLKNIETALRSGFYTHIRDLYNKSLTGKLIISTEKQSSLFYFIREFCYGAMFRYNSQGEFNIPYGGMAYNKKNLRRKVDNIFNQKTRKLLENTIIGNEDFEDFLESLNLTEKDFLFLDPPYDSEFSDYSDNAWTRKDQQRLANYLHNTLAKFVLIIKETDFIKEIYSKDPKIKITSFNKTYLYNVRGRNDRKVNHLIITNFSQQSESKNSIYHEVQLQNKIDRRLIKNL